jgi:hypothetical protein
MADTSKTLEVLQALQDLTDKLTWRRILTAFLTGLIALVLFTGYEHRGTVVKYIFRDVDIYQDWGVSTSTGLQLRGLVEQNSLVSMIFVEKVDLQKNRRVPKYWFLNNAQEEFNKQMQEHLPDAAFDDDSASVQQLIGVLNNEFVCVKFESTPLSHTHPKLKTVTPVVCSIAVPPFYGRMLGILTIGLAQTPTPQEHAAIRLEATRLAVEIYLHDIAKRSK